MGDLKSSFLVGRVEGSSMFPAMDHGDRVLVDCRKASPERDDVVVVRGVDGLVVHRVVDITAEGLVTQGDNRPTSDGIGSMDLLAGKAVVVGHKGTFWKKPSSAAESRWWRTGLGRKIRRYLRTAKDRAEGVLSMNQRFEIQELGKELAIHDRKTGEVHLLNETAAMIWKAVGEGKSNAEATRQLAAHFRMEPDALRNDVDLIVSDFASKGMLENTQEKE